MQLTIQTGQTGYLYAYHLDHDGRLVHLADADDSTPFSLEVGRVYNLPSGQPFDVDWTVPPSAVYFVFLPERDLELEELYQRLLRAPQMAQESMRRRLVGRIARRAANRVELPLAAAIEGLP